MAPSQKLARGFFMSTLQGWTGLPLGLRGFSLYSPLSWLIRLSMGELSENLAVHRRCPGGVR